MVNERRAALIVIILALVAQASSAEPAMGEWRVQRFTDVMDDSVRVVSDLRDDKGSTRLYVRCQHNDLEVYIVWGDDGYFGNSTSIESQTRVDGAEMVSEDWSVSTNGSSLFSPDVDGLLSRIVYGSRLIVRVTPPNKSPVTVSFDLDGIRWALMPVADMCGILWKMAGNRAVDVNETSVLWSLYILQEFSQGKGSVPDNMDRWRPLIAKGFEVMRGSQEQEEEAD